MKSFSPSPSGLERKYFTTDLLDASRYSKRAFYSRRGEYGPYYAFKAEIDEASILEEKVFVDGGIGAIVIELDKLSNFINIAEENTMRNPGALWV